MFFIKFQEYFEKMYLYSWFYGHSKDIKDFLLFFLSLFVKQNALELQAFFSSADFFGILGNLEQEKYFTDRRTANTIQLFVIIREQFSGLFFY